MVTTVQVKTASSQQRLATQQRYTTHNSLNRRSSNATLKFRLAYLGASYFVLVIRSDVEILSFVI